MKKNYAMAIAMITSIGMTFASCTDDNNDNVKENVSLNSNKMPTLTGTVIEAQKLLNDAAGRVDTFDCYGMLVPSFTPQDLKDKGFEYGDLLNVKIGDKIELKNVPFITGFNEVGVFETCFCDYNQLNTVFGFGQLHGNFKERIGGKAGDQITVTLAQHQGYKDTWEVMKSVYTYERTDYPNENDEEFANFRPVTTTGMGQGVLYRSSNSLNPKDNKVRYAYVDRLAKQYGINTEIDLADTDEKITEYMAGADYQSTYCPQLFKNNKVIALGLTADTYGKTFMETLGNGLRFMINNKPPYLLHCNEGKDRCGFVTMLLEAFAGASYDEVAADYMKTLMNFYKIDRNSDSYKMRQQLSIDRLVWLLENVENVQDISSIDWTKNDPKSVNLQTAADNYIKNCGLNSAERAQLRNILQGNAK